MWDRLGVMQAEGPVWNGGAVENSAGTAGDARVNAEAGARVGVGDEGHAPGTPWDSRVDVEVVVVDEGT